MDRTRLHSSYSHPIMRQWHNIPRIQASDIILPIFVTDKNSIEEIEGFPNQYRIGVSKLKPYISKLISAGLKSILVFGVLDANGELNKAKDNVGSACFENTAPASLAIKLLKSEFPGLLVIADVCLCAYTSHGHCGVLDKNGLIDNDRSAEKIAELAALYAAMGADVVAPSDMMDGRVSAIKARLLRAGCVDRVAVMSYSAKFCSALYGPFRNVCKSAVNKSSGSLKDRASYQLPVGSRKLAINAAERDLREGADFLIVKPAGFIGV